MSPYEWLKSTGLRLNRFYNSVCLLLHPYPDNRGYYSSPLKLVRLGASGPRSIDLSAAGRRVIKLVLRQRTRQADSSLSPFGAHVPPHQNGRNANQEAYSPSTRSPLMAAKKESGSYQTKLFTVFLSHYPGKKSCELMLASVLPGTVKIKKL